MSRTHCCGFKTCNTQKTMMMLVILNMQVAQRKKTMTMNDALVVVDLKCATHKKTKMFIVLVSKLITHK